MDITIVIPVYNRKALIRHTLSSIAKSPLSRVPVIVVDNGSTDGTRDFLESYSSTHENLTFTTETYRNAAAARNKGLSLVQTGWVYFFDSDDEFEDLPHKWDLSADLIAFPTRQKKENRISVRKYKPVADPAVHIINGMLSTQSMIMRTSWLRAIGGWNTSCRIWDDWELGARALMSSPRIQWITDKAYHTILVHNESLTGPDFSSGFGRQIEAISEVLKLTSGMQDKTTAERCRIALMLRIFILSGKLLYEGDKKHSDLCHTYIKENFGKNPHGYITGWLLEQYTALGGRGAWKIAVTYISGKKRP